MINLKLIAISTTAGLLIGLLNGFAGGYKWQQGTIDDLIADHARQIAQIEAESERDLKERQDQINHWQSEFSKAEENYLEKLKNAKAENDRLNDCIDSGECVPTVEVEREVCGAGGENAATEKNAGKERVRLSKQTAKDLISIAKADDTEAIDCNQLIDWVEIGIKSGQIKAEIL